MTGSADFHMERYTAHNKWRSRHLQSAIASAVTVVGIPCLAVFIPKWLHHRKKAKEHKRKAEEAEEQ